MLYAVRQEGDRWIFVPSRIFAASMVGMFSGGSLLMLYLSTIFFRHMGRVSADFWIGDIFVLIGGLPRQSGDSRVAQPAYATDH